MKDLLAGLLALIESKSVPAAYKFLVGVAVLAILLRVAGFPVVSYVETGVKAAFTKAPLLSSLVTGLFIGWLVGRPLKSVSNALVKLSVLAFHLVIIYLSNQARQPSLPSSLGLTQDNAGELHTKVARPRFTRRMYRMCRNPLPVSLSGPFSANTQPPSIRLRKTRPTLAFCHG